MNLNDYEFELFRFSVQFLFDHATFSDGIIHVDETLGENGILSKEKKRNCHVFSQTLKEYPRLRLEEFCFIYCLMDFKYFEDFEKLAQYPNGFEITINGKSITFVMFLKSNSMSKNSTMLYINKDYYDVINERVNFHYDEVDNLVLAKWFAYSGLSLTDATIIDKLKFQSDEVCIVDDKDVTEIAENIVTGISVPLILDKLQIYKESEEDLEQRERIKKEFECYIASPDYSSLTCRDLIEKGYNYIKNPANLNLFDEILKEYAKDLDTLGTITWEKIFLENYPLDINVFDGEGLIDLGSAEEINSYLKGKDDFNFLDEDFNDEYDQEYDQSPISYSYQIRLPFIKGVVHACDFKTFFREKGIKKIRGLSFSNKCPYHEYDIEKLKLILTKSQFKAAAIFKELLKQNPRMDCLEEYFNYLDEFDYSLGISGFEPKQEDQVKLCYQFLSTLPLNEEELNHLINYNIDFLNQRTSLDTLIEELTISKETKDVNFINTYHKNPDFALQCSYFNEHRKEIYNELRKKMKVGKLFCSGHRKILCSDLLGLLYHSAGLKMPQNEKLPLNNFFAPGDEFINNDNYIFLRNPHYSRNEIVLLKNDSNNEEREYYFSHLTGVVMLNPRSFASERLGGADYDGDAVLIIKDEKIINACKNRLFENGKYIYPVVKIPSIKIKRSNFKTNSYQQKIICIRNTFDNSTGVISNIAYSHTASVYFKGKSIRESDSIAFYTILGGLEIDSAKSGKKPCLDNILSNYTPPLFIKLKDHILKRKTIESKDGGFINVEKRYLKSETHDLIYLTYAAFKNLKMDKIEHKEVKLNKIENIDIEKTKKILVHFETLRYLFDGLDKIKKIKKSNIKSVKEYIINEVTNIFEANGYDVSYVSKFIKKFQTLKPYETLEKYCDDNSYHFMNNLEDKLDYLIEFHLDLTDLDRRIVTNFSNNGFKLLYLVFQYHRLPVPVFNIAFDTLIENENPFIHSREELINFFSRSDILDARKQIFEDLNSINQNLPLNESITKIKDKFELRYNIDLSDVTLNDLNVVFDVFKSNLLFSTYKTCVERYLKEDENNDR